MGIFSRKKNSMLNDNSQQEIHIKQITINSTRDCTVLRQKLLDGNVIICNLKPLIRSVKKDRTNRELHNSLQRIKNFCLKYGGKVSKLEESFLLVTPNSNFSINK